MDHNRRHWYISHQRAANAEASLHKCADLLEHLPLYIESIDVDKSLEKIPLTLIDTSARSRGYYHYYYYYYE